MTATRVAAVRDDAAALLSAAWTAAAPRRHGASRLHEEALARNPALLQAHVNLITLYARTGNMPKAEEHYRAVIARGLQLAEAHHAFGLSLLAAREPARAEPILRLAIEANPQDAEALNALGLIQESSGRLADAEALYRRAVEANPRARGLRFNLARILVSHGTPGRRACATRR